MNNKKTKKNIEDIKEDEPNWYHYLLILLIILGIFFIFYIGYYLFIEEETNLNELNSTTQTTVYPYKVGNITYNIHFHNTINEIKKMNYSINLNKIQLLNTQKFYMAFLNYNGTDNKHVSKASTKMTSFLSTVYHFKFSKKSFAMIDKLNCTNSTLKNKVIIFNPYQNKTGIFFNKTNGCIKIYSKEPETQVNLIDNLIYNILIT